MTFVSEVFVALARLEAKSFGLEALPIVSVPHPMATRSEAVAEAIARDRVAEVLAALEQRDDEG